MIVEREHPTAGTIRLTGVPVKLRGTPGSVRRAPPQLGENTQELLKELGYAQDAIDSLRSEKLVATNEDVQHAKEERSRRKQQS